MVSSQCPHCDHVVKAESFGRGTTITCPSCKRIFLPVVMTESEAPPPAPAPPPPRPSGLAPVGGKKTQQVAAGPQRVKVVACPKCRALLRFAGGESRLGRCHSCTHVFVFDDTAISELVVPSSEVEELPRIELLAIGATEGDDDDDEVGATIMRTTARAGAAVAPRETVRCVLVGDSPRIRYELAKDVVLIGRHNADLTVNDPDVSRRHCTVERSAGKVIIRDLKSTNGTLVNGVRVDVEVLKDGDRIRVGSTELRLVVTSEGEKEKYAALFVDLGPGSPEDAKLVLRAMDGWARTDLGEFNPDMIMSTATGRGMAIWRFNAEASSDERRRLVPKLMMSPAALRVELATVALSSGRSSEPLIGLVIGLAKRSVASGRVKFEGPLLKKAALAVKVSQRDAVCISDIESLELLTGEKGLPALASRLRDLGLRAAPAGDDQPFVVIRSAEAIKDVKSAASPGRKRALLGAVSTIEAELLEILAAKCEKEFEAGLSLSFANSNARGVSGIFKKLKGATAETSEPKARTLLYEKILGGSAIYLGKGDVVRWMELLRDVGQRYSDALKVEKERAGAERGDEPAWDDLIGLSDETLLAASEAAVLLRAAFFRGDSMEGATLSSLAHRCSEAIAAGVPAKYDPVPLPLLGQVYAILHDAVDVPSNSADARGLFEFYVLLSLTGVTNAIANQALRQAQHYGDVSDVDNVKQTYGAQLRILKNGLAEMSQVVAIFKLLPPLRTVGKAKSIFDRYELPAYALIP